MPRKTTNDRMQENWDLYLHFVQNLADERFNQVVKPWLQKRGYTMAHGVYGWVIGRPDPARPGRKQAIEPDDLPKFIQVELRATVPGNTTSDLGDYMPDYFPEEEASNEQQ